MPGGDPPLFSLRLRAAATRRLPPAHACGRSLFGEPKKKTAVEPSKKNALSPCGQALRALPPGGTRVVTVLLSRPTPYVTTGGVPIKPPSIVRRAALLIHRAKPELTSYYPRAPRSAQRSLVIPGPNRETAAPPPPCRGGLRPRPFPGLAVSPDNPVGAALCGRPHPLSQPKRPQKKGLPRRFAPRNDRG